MERRVEGATSVESRLDLLRALRTGLRSTRAPSSPGTTPRASTARRDVAPGLELPLDLLAPANERNTVLSKSTYRLLDDLAGDLARGELRVLVALLKVLRDRLLNHVRDVRAHVRRAVCRSQVDPRTLRVTAERRVVPQAVARSILAHRQRTHVLLQDGGRQGIWDLDAHRQTLPRVVCLGPPPPALHRPLRAVVDFLEVVVHELHGLVEAHLVVPVQVRKADLDPPQAALAERLRLVEQEGATAKVITDVA